MTAHPDTGTFHRTEAYPRGDEVEVTHPGTDDVVHVYVTGRLDRDGAIWSPRIHGARILGALNLGLDALKATMTADEWAAFEDRVWDAYRKAETNRDRTDPLRAA